MFIEKVWRKVRRSPFMGESELVSLLKELSTSINSPFYKHSTATRFFG